MKRVACVVAMVVAGVAWAGKKTVVIAAGDCSDAGLISGAKDFRDAVARELGGSLMEGEVVLDIVRPRPTRSVSDIERQVDSARTLFYGGQVDRAEQLVDRALEELERATPEAKPWPVTQNALVLKALIAKNADRSKDMADAFRRIVRVDPAFKLDPDAHPPSAIAALDAVKKELARARKTTVTVRIDPAGPPGAVFLDGMPVGAAPLKLDLVPGTYRVAIVSGSMVSFPHRLEVPKDTKLGVDFAFEGSVGTQAPLCMHGALDAPAIKLSQLVAAEQVIVLRNGGRRGEPVYLSGTLYELSSGKQERAGSVQPELIPALATFLVTGREVVGVQRGTAPPALATVEPKVDPPKADAPKSEPVKVKEPVKVAEPVKEPTNVEVPKLEPTRPPRTEPLKQPPPAHALTSPPPSNGRVGSYVLLGAGGVAAIGGLVVFLASGLDRGRVEGLTRDPNTGETKIPDPTSQSTARTDFFALSPRVDTMNVLSLTLAGAGVGLGIAGLVGLQLFPESKTSLAVSPTPGGGAISVSGQF